MIRKLGEGYYGVEATRHSISDETMQRMKAAYERVMAIPDDQIMIVESAYRTISPGKSRSEKSDVVASVSRRS